MVYRSAVCFSCNLRIRHDQPWLDNSANRRNNDPNSLNVPTRESGSTRAHTIANSRPDRIEKCSNSIRNNRQQNTECHIANSRSLPRNTNHPRPILDATTNLKTIEPALCNLGPRSLKRHSAFKRQVRARKVIEVWLFHLYGRRRQFI